MDAWNRGDWDGAVVLVSPDFELDNSSNRADWRGVHRGPDALKRLWSTMTEPWEWVYLELEDFLEAPGDRVVTRQTMYFRGRDGIGVSARMNWVWEFRGGAVIRLLALNERDDALRAAGLSA